VILVVGNGGSRGSEKLGAMSRGREIKKALKKELAKSDRKLTEKTKELRLLENLRG